MIMLNMFSCVYWLLIYFLRWNSCANILPIFSGLSLNYYGIRYFYLVWKSFFQMRVYFLNCDFSTFSLILCPKIYLPTLMQQKYFLSLILEISFFKLLHVGPWFITNYFFVHNVRYESKHFAHWFYTDIQLLESFIQKAFFSPLNCLEVLDLFLDSLLFQRSIWPKTTLSFVIKEDKH